MGLRKKFKVKNLVHSTTFRNGYDGYNLYLVKEEPENSWAKADDFYILTRESLSPGQSTVAEETELVDADRFGNKHYNNLRLHVYRPEKALNAGFRVKDQILSNDLHKRFTTAGVDVNRHHLVLAARPPIAGYREEGTLSYIFSAAAFRKGEMIPALEVKKMNDLPDIANHHFYLHNEAQYRERVWAAVRAACK